MNFEFSAGQRLSIGNKTYLLHRVLPGKQWQLVNELDGELVNKTKEELLCMFRENELSFISTYAESKEEIAEAADNKIKKDISDYPEELRKIVENRLKYVRAILSIPPGEHKLELERLANILGDKTAPSISTVRRWKKLFKQSGKSVAGLIPKNDKRGNRNSRFSDEVIKIAADVLRRMHLSEQRNTIDETLSALRNEIEIQNKLLPAHKKLPKPGMKFLRNLIEQVSAYEKMRARHGKAAADRHFRQSCTSGEPEYEPLARVEIDHTVLDLIIVDPETFLPLGRPTITMALDRRSRCITGYNVSFEPPSYVQVMRCLAHAIMPKDYVRSKYPQIENPWLCWGIPNQIVVDNGREFHSKDLEAAALSLLINVRYCPVAKPWWKGAIERSFGTMNKSLIHTLPGTTFSNVTEKDTYKSIEHAVITRDVLDEVIHNWICDVYHQTPHRSTLLPPAMLWRDLIDTTNQQLPESAEVLDIKLGSIETRTLFRYGINLNNLNYNSSELQALNRNKGNITVTIRWDRSDLGYIHILDEHTKEYIKVPCTWFGYANGISLWLHKEIRREAEKRVGEENQVKLDEAKARIRAICEKAMSNKRLSIRKNAARAEPGLKVGKSTVSGTTHDGTQCKTTFESIENSPSINAERAPSSDEVTGFGVKIRPKNPNK